MTRKEPIRPLRWWNPWDFLRLLGWIGFQPSNLYGYIVRRWPELADKQAGPFKSLSKRFHATASLIMGNIHWLWLLVVSLSFLIWALFPEMHPHLKWVDQQGSILWVRFLTDCFTGVAFGVAVGVAGGVAFIVSIIAAVLRPHVWLLESAVFLLARYGKLWAIPTGWDELTPLPYPDLGSRLSKLVRQRDLAPLLSILSRTLANPGQRWAAQSTLRSYFHAVESPLWAFAMVLRDPILDPSAFWDPVDIRPDTTLRCLLLAELALRPKKGSILGETIFLKLTAELRDNSPAGWPERVAGAYLDLILGERIQLHSFDPDARFQGSDVLHGQFACLDKALSARSAEEIADYVACIDQSIFDTGLPETFAEVNAALGRLTAIARRLTEARADTRPRAFQDGISACLGELNRLKVDLGADVVPLVEPYRRLVGEVVEQWRDILTQAGAETVEQRLTRRLINPYEAGLPVTGSLFVGRDPILNQLSELWDVRRTGHSSVLLFGHRRTGKTSILRNLRQALGDDSMCAFADLQRLAMEKDNSGFLARLARLLSDSLHEDSGVSIPVPDRVLFEQSPNEGFDEFLKALKGALVGRPCFAMVDELEVLAEGLNRGLYSPGLIDYLRSVIQKEEWLAFAFAARHTFEEEQLHHLGKPLFSSIRLIKVSLLEKEDARSVLERPCDDFDVSYTPEATDRILQLCGGQPFVLQLFGWHLVSRLNTLIHDRGLRRRPRVELADVNEILNKAGFWDEFAAWGDGVCSELGTETTALLKSFAQQNFGLRAAQPIPGFAQANNEPVGFERLIKHEIIAPVAARENKYVFTVPLLGNWLVR